MRCREQVLCFDKGKGLKLSVIAEDQVIFIEKRLNLWKRLQTILDVAEVAALFDIFQSDLTGKDLGKYFFTTGSGETQIVQLMQPYKMMKFHSLKADSKIHGLSFSSDDDMVFYREQIFKCFRTGQ